MDPFQDETPSGTRSRRWCFTINNYKDEDIQSVRDAKWSYVVFGYETAPTTGTPHLQGYIEFKNQCTRSSLCKRLPRAHVVPAKGTPAQASVYCKKGDEFEEHGTMTHQGKRTDIQTVCDSITEGSSFEEILDKATSYQSLQVAKVAFPYKEPKRDWIPTVYWYWGPPGTSKTHTAYHMFKNLPIHIQAGSSKWWQGYDRHPVVIIDDLRSTHIDFVRLLQLLDRYPCTVENKGGSRQFVPEHIFITSPYHPLHMFADHSENIQQLIRRITHIQEFDVYYVEPSIIPDDAVHSASSPQVQAHHEA